MKFCIQCLKQHDRKKFCSNKCKDRYHNLNNPRGKFAHLKDKNKKESYEEHHFSSEGLGINITKKDFKKWITRQDNLKGLLTSTGLVVEEPPSSKKPCELGYKPQESPPFFIEKSLK